MCLFNILQREMQGKNEGKYQESIQSSTTSDPGDTNEKVTTSQLDITNLPFYRFYPTRLMGSIKHENSCKILYLFAEIITSTLLCFSSKKKQHLVRL